MKYLAAIFLLIFSLSASAETCENISDLAETVMVKRQEGFQMERIYNAAEGELAKKIVQDAYSQPFYSTNEHKNRAVNEFASKWFRLCLKSTENKKTASN